jgi:hypothetical protein
MYHRHKLLDLVLSRRMCDYGGSLDWWMDLLTTYKHDSELQEITALQLITSKHDHNTR